MSIQPTLPRRFAGLDAMRGICALLVGLFHLPVYHALKDAAWFPNLQACVDFFFVLSGFVLFHAYRERLATGADLKRFAVARFARLWPLHAAMLALFVALELAKLWFSRANPAFALEAQPFGAGHSFWELATNLLFLQSFHLHPDLSWNGPAWSAAVEFYVSIAFAACLLAFGRGSARLFILAAAASAVTLAILSPQTIFVSHDWGVLRCLFGFCTGCAVCMLRRRGPERLPMPTLLEAGILLLCAAVIAWPATGLAQYAFPLLAGAAIYVLSFEGGAVSRALAVAALQKLGLWSYSIYMVHTFLFQLLRTGATFADKRLGGGVTLWHNGEKLVALGGPMASLLWGIVILVALLPIAALTYRFIESPGIAAGRRRASGPGPAQGRSPASVLAPLPASPAP